MPRRAQHVELGLAEVVADRPDDAHLVEERGGQREVHGGAAEHPLALPEGRLHRVEGDRSDDCDRHGAAYPTIGIGACTGARRVARAHASPAGCMHAAPAHGE